MARNVIAILLVAVSPALGAQAPAARPTEAQQARPAQAGPGRTAAPAEPKVEFLSPYDRDALTPEYRIAPGDVLQIIVWREPDLSREVRVRPDGYVSVALVGDLFAVAKTPKGLAAELTQALARYVNGPIVTVTLVSSSTLRFYVVGQVLKPGEFPLVGRTTVMQALALAGGFQEYAKLEEIKVLRQELSVSAGQPKSREIVLAVNYKASAQRQNLHQHYALKPGDVIVVP